ncbi:RIP metalloprotease RseP [Nevskia ramosa]|uniref:RIP metalloprotease RseP n=1 Tax=Nevskia ramosa TaxID=64002 RepID=UPI0003B46218|nr:RIP metalloprotease RseP [Nevskia ramosa]
MLDTLHSAASFIVAIGVLVAFHEFGHFWVARRFGIKVLKFSIGFGKPLWSRRGKDGVEYVLAMIPLGGYVKLLDEREADVVIAPEDLPRAFNRQPVAKRIAVFAAGPAFNFILAIAFYWVLYMVGVPGMKPVIGAPPAGSLAATAGLVGGDRIVALDDQKIPTWSVLRAELLDRALSRGDTAFLVAHANGREQTVNIDLGKARVDPVLLFEDLGLNPFEPPIPAVVGQVVAGEAADRAGLKIGDRIVDIDGKPVASFQDLRSQVSARPGQLAKFGIERAGSAQQISVIIGTDTSHGEAIGRVGLAPQRMATEGDLWQDLRAEVRLGPLAAASAALHQTWQVSALTVRLLYRMVVGDVSVKNVSGPIQIAQAAGYSASAGIGAFLTFVALVSVSIGVFNLLPIPMLDGGQILFGVIEAVKGSPLSERVQAAGQQLGMTLLLMLMGLAFYNDVTSVIG